MEQHTTTGLIMLKNKLGIEYKISKIEYITYEDDSFEYIFTPYYSVIDLLTSDLFQGIPGLDLDLKHKKYIRKNIIPVFISERTPCANRVNLRELLEEAGMKYLNQLEWLIRTNYTYSGDHFYVVRYDDCYEDEFHWDTGQQILGAANYSTQLVSAISHGQRIVLDGNVLGNSEVVVLHKVLIDLLESNKKIQLKNRQSGIEKASANGIHAGRKKKEIDEIYFTYLTEKYQKGEISVKELIRELGISRATFYRRLQNKIYIKK